jgi:hypothetical protein
MGKEYRLMLDLVRWRKAVGRKETVALNENLLLGKADSADYPDLLADVLDGVMSMTEENWQDIRRNPRTRRVLFVPVHTTDAT